MYDSRNPEAEKPFVCRTGVTSSQGPYGLWLDWSCGSESWVPLAPREPALTLLEWVPSWELCFLIKRKKKLKCILENLLGFDSLSGVRNGSQASKKCCKLQIRACLYSEPPALDGGRGGDTIIKISNQNMAHGNFLTPDPLASWFIFHPHCSDREHTIPLRNTCHSGYA